MLMNSGEYLASDLRLEFPNSKGYSVRNLKYMAKFAETYPDREFVQTVSAQISWSHNVSIHQIESELAVLKSLSSGSKHT